MKQWKMESPVGPLYLMASATALHGAGWRKHAGVPMAESLQGQAPELRMLARAVKELEEYFAGRRREFSVPLSARGTDFQKLVWDTLARIPYGQTCSYKDVAVRIRKPGAVRAVGTANGRNPICIIVPCHRVIAADGGLGGFAGGLEAKSTLLELERGALSG
jgi:methylated-DNA-[protein]-cysteine S-methyltransferase